MEKPNTAMTMKREVAISRRKKTVAMTIMVPAPQAMMMRPSSPQARRGVVAYRPARAKRMIQTSTNSSAAERYCCSGTSWSTGRTPVTMVEKRSEYAVSAAAVNANTSSGSWSAVNVRSSRRRRTKYLSLLYNKTRRVSGCIVLGSAGKPNFVEDDHLSVADIAVWIKRATSLFALRR